LKDTIATWEGRGEPGAGSAMAVGSVGVRSSLWGRTPVWGRRDAGVREGAAAEEGAGVGEGVVRTGAAPCEHLGRDAPASGLGGGGTGEHLIATASGGARLGRGGAASGSGGSGGERLRMERAERREAGG